MPYRAQIGPFRVAGPARDCLLAFDVFGALAAEECGDALGRE